MVLWFRKNTISFAVQWCSLWEIKNVGLFRFHKNDWSLGWSCLDLNMNILKLSISLTFWNMPFQKFMVDYND